MKKIKNDNKILAVLLCAGLALASQAARADVLASDTFTSPNGTALDTTSTPVGGLAWNDGTTGGMSPMPNNFSQIDNGGVISVADTSQRYVSAVPFALSSYSPTYTTFSVQASLDSQGAGDFNGVGFGNSTGATDFTFGTSNLWVLLTTSGTWDLLENGPNVVPTATGAAPSFVASGTGFNTVDLTYNVNTTLATVVINGTSVFSADVTGFNASTIAYAGVEQFDQSNTNTTSTPEFDNFSLSASPSLSVPEPSVTILLGLGFMTLVALRRARRIS